MKNNFTEIKDYLRQNLSEQRYLHTLAVAEECDAMADIFSLSDDDKKILHCAALLHDITKEKNPDEHIELCRVYNIEYSDVYISTPSLFHAKTGAAYAMHIFPQYCHEKTAELISTHTTGCTGMSLLQKLLFLSDGIEKTRKHETLKKLRQYFYDLPQDETLQEHLDKTIIKYIDLTIEFLISKNQVIDIETVNTRNDLLIQTR